MSRAGRLIPVLGGIELAGYDIYLKTFWAAHRKVEFETVESWNAYDEACRSPKQRLGRAKTVDHCAMTGEAYLAHDGKVLELVQSTSGFRVPQVRTFANLADWNDWAIPMPYSVYVA